MAFVLPRVNSPLQELAPYIQQATGQIAEGYQKRQEQQLLNQNLSILSDPNASSAQKAHAFSRMPESYKKSASPVWAAVLGPQAQSTANINELKSHGINFQDQKDQENQNKNNLQQLSDEQLVAMGALGGASEKLASGEMKRREAQVKKDEALWNYKPTQDFLKDIEDEARSASTAIEVADEFIKLAQSGEISPSNLRNFAASKFGEALPFLHSPATAQAKLLEKLQAAGMKDIFPKPTEREFLFINSAQAQLGKSDAANIAVAQLNKKFSAIPIKAAEFSQEVIQENGGVPPRNLTAQVRKKMDAYKKDLLQDAASITFEYGDQSERKNAANFLQTKGKNLPLTDEKKKEIFELSGKDPEKALKLAIELGYKIP